MSTIKAPPVYKVIVAQLFAALCLSAAGFLVLGWISTYSLLLGGLISALPNAYFANRAFRYRGARATEKIVRELYTGEAIKLLLTASGFGLCFVIVEPLDAAALFSGFVLVHITGVLMFVRISRPARTNP